MITRKTIREIAPVIAIIATIIGATWILSEKINESRVEFHQEIGEVREEFRKEISKLSEGFHKEIGKLREGFHKEIGKLREDIKNVDTKFDAFMDSHRREHDLFYGAADKENSTSAN
ncbi:MAG: hypothetical protein OXF24_03225 [Hyphomicrobiales bacterium]|nr:hypothetical protein [Hyphomicrobiales bacterium]MCY4052603.1 hypothetical protein [Hyphomicrobiales bacterium]